MKDKAQDALNSIKNGIIAVSDIETLQSLINIFQEVLEDNAFLNYENKQLLERIKRLEERVWSIM